MTGYGKSIHLRKDEKKMIENLLGNDTCKAMAIAEVATCCNSKIVTNVLQKGNDSKQIQEFQWKSIDSIKPGLICFVQDSNLAYYIRAFNLEKEILAFELQIHLKLEYRRRRRHLITFELEQEILCLNFVDDDEADNFAVALSKVIRNSKPVCNILNNSQNNFPQIEDDGIIDRERDKKEKKKSKKEKKKGIWGQMFGRKSHNKEQIKFSQDNLRHQIGEEEFTKVKIFLQVARLDPIVLDDPEKGPTFYQFYKDNVAGKHVIEEDRKDEYGQVEDIFDDEDLYDDVVLSEEEGEEDDFFAEEYTEEEVILEEKKPEVMKSKVKNMKWPPEPTNDDLGTIDSTSAPPPPPPPPPPAPAPLISSSQLLIPTKSNTIATQNKHQDNSGNSREDLMSAIKAGGKSVLKKAPPPKVIKDVKSLTDTSLSDLLGGALQKIKNANSLYGDEPNLDSDSEGSGSDWSN